MHRLFPVVVLLSVVFGLPGGAMVAQEGVSGAEIENPYANMMVNALFDKRVQKDLELVDDQKMQLKALMDEIQAKRKEMTRTLQEFAQNASKVDIEDKRAELVASFETFKNQYQTSLQKVLLPHQQKRLGQLAVQLMIRDSQKKYPVSVLAPEMKKFLRIDEQQAKKINDKAIEVRERLAAEIKKLTDNAKSELLEQLTTEQRQKYAKLVGDPMGK